MANIINGDSGSTSGSAGVKIGADGSNSLAIQTNNVTAITIDGLQNANFVSTGAITLAAGSTAQRPTAINGMIRYNTSNNAVEAYANSAWTNLTLPSISPAQVSDQNNTSTGYFSIPIGTTAQRPAGPSLGAMRWNSNSSSMEVFIGSSTWVNVASSTSPSYSIQYLVVAGGGGAGSAYAGSGGGGGGVLTAQTTVVPSTAYTITIGAGGAGSPASSGTAYGANGANTTFGAFATSIGGGGAGGYTSSNGQPGGCGGGGGNGLTIDTYTPGGSGTAGQGYGGGAGIRVTGPPSSMMAAGGGGAGGVGSNGQAIAYGTSGAGGIGFLSAISGSANYYSGGGGGGGCNYAPYQSYANFGGQGGGGSGTTGGAGSPGSANTGGGGGGMGNDTASSNGYASGSGGSGIVIISYPGVQRGNGGSITYTGFVTIHTFTTSGTYTA